MHMHVDVLARYLWENETYQLKSSISLESKITNFARASRFFCTFPCRHFACARHRVKVPNFTLCGGCKHKTPTFFFFSATSIQFF